MGPEVVLRHAKGAPHERGPEECDRALVRSVPGASPSDIERVVDVDGEPERGDPRARQRSARARQRAGPKLWARTQLRRPRL
eukprot:8781525-Alexandrium_andersonii.AAC.1